MITMSTILAFFFILCVGALLWWGVSRLTLPEPIKTIALVMIGLVLLFLLWGLFTGHGAIIAR